jgi:two-component system, chemotaxis family, chemotaxis protein CheY
VADKADASLSDLAARFAEMGVAVEPMPGGRCLRGRLRLSAEPFSSLEGSRRYEAISFSTVGAMQIKCLAPLPFFFLPLIALGGCASSGELEARIRTVWAARERSLRAAAQKLSSLGIVASPESGGQVLAFPLGHDDTHAAVRLLDAQRVILPGRGPLSSLRAASPEQRVARLDPAWSDASDAEIALTERLGELRERLASERPPLIVPARALPASLAAQALPRGGARLLLVGPHLGRDAALARRLEQRGFRVRVEFSAHEALEAFREQSFEIVFADTHLGRSEGLELISDLRGLPGVENVPVVLVDEHAREPVRDAARKIGAAGYLVHPLEGDRVALGVARILQSRARRRYSRLPWRLSVRLSDGRGAFTTSIARLGAFIGGEWREPLDTLRRCEIELPELGRVLRVDAEGVYRVDPAGTGAAGIGVLFRGFGARDEAAWITYLAELFGSPPARRPD